MNFSLFVAYLKTISENAFAAVLTATLDIDNLPFQCPMLNILDDVDDLQAALCEGVIAPYGKGCVVQSIFDKAFLFKLLQAR